MSHYRIFWIFFLLVFAGMSCFADHGQSERSLQQCVNYEPDVVTLAGSVSKRTFVNAINKKEIVWVLHLDKPLCVNAQKDDDFNVKRSRVTDMQLVLDPDMYTRYRTLVGKRVTANGTLFGEQTAHHFTPVLLDVKEIRAVQ